MCIKLQYLLIYYLNFLIFNCQSFVSNLFLKNMSFHIYIIYINIIFFGIATAQDESCLPPLFPTVRFLFPSPIPVSLFSKHQVSFTYNLSVRLTPSISPRKILFVSLSFDPAYALCFYLRLLRFYISILIKLYFDSSFIQARIFSLYLTGFLFVLRFPLLTYHPFSFKNLKRRLICFYQSAGF